MIVPISKLADKNLTSDQKSNFIEKIALPWVCGCFDVIFGQLA